MTVATFTANACPSCGADVLPAMARCRECGVVLHDATDREPNVARTNGSQKTLDGFRQSDSAFDLDAMYQAAGIEGEAETPPATRKPSDQPVPSSRSEPSRSAESRQEQGPSAGESVTRHQRSGESGKLALNCRKCGREVKVPPSLQGKLVKCPGCGEQLPVSGAASAETETDVRVRPGQRRREYNREEVQHQLQVAVNAALAADPARTSDGGTTESVRCSDLRRLKRTLGKVVSGTPSVSQLDAAEAAIGQVGCANDQAVTSVLLEHLDRLPASLFLLSLRTLAERGAPAVFEPLMRALPGADEQSLGALLQICGESGDLRIMQPLLVAAARCPRHRSQAIESLKGLGTAAVPSLLRAAQSSAANDPELRCAAIEVLERIADARTVPRLSKLVNDPDAGVRYRVVKGLSAIESRAAVKPLVGALSDAEPDVRAAAAAGLTQRANPKLAPHLAKLLNDDSPEVRLQAVKGLGLCGEPAVASRLRPLLSSGDEELELAAAESIARLGDEKIVPDLLDRLQHEMENRGSEPGAGKIIDALRRLKDDRALLPLVDMLGHADDKLRARAAEALGQIGDPAAVDSLTDVLLREYSATAQAAIAKALGELKDPKAIPALEHALQQSAHVRCKAIIALGEIGGRRAFRSLLELTKDPDAIVRYHAANTLAKTGDRAAIAALERLTLDSDQMVRRSAFKALEELGDDRSQTEIVRNAQDTVTSDDKPEATQQTSSKRLRRFDLQQLVPDMLMGVDFRQLIVYGAGLLAVVAVVALVIWGRSAMQSDQVLARGYVSRVAISGDGQMVAVMRSLGLFEVWDVESERVTFQSPDLQFRDVVIAPDGSAALGLGGGTLTHLQFDAEHSVTGQVTYPGPGDSIIAFGESPSGSLLVTMSDTSEAVGWNVTTGEGEWSLQLPPSQFETLAVNETGDRLAGVTDRGELLIWNTQDGQLSGEFVFSGPLPDFLSLSFDTSGSLLAASSRSGHVFIWEVDRLRTPVVKVTSAPMPQVLRFVDSETLLLSVSDRLETWSVDGEEPHQQFRFDADIEGGYTTAVSGDGASVVVGADESNPAYVFDVASGNLEHTLSEE